MADDATRAASVILTSSVAANPAARDVEAITETKARDALQTTLTLALGDLVIHSDHGLGRFAGLTSIGCEGDVQDLLEVTYRDGKLLVPAAEAGLLSRFGRDTGGLKLDLLGGRAWIGRKTRAARHIGMIARRLVGIAAMRALATAPVLQATDGRLAEFADGFPHEPTPDQVKAIADVRRDMASGKPMDRLVCGDVGCGKTEIALRAAFIAADAGVQVAVIAPTTILAQQHTETFRDRFRQFGIRVEHASRLATAGASKSLREFLAGREAGIVIGTHALLAKDIVFRNLGLLIVDEEHRFGVQHKERLKQLREGVHVLTLTATPIPRTMQLALSPVRELSLIMTPPSGRKAVLTTVAPAAPSAIMTALRAEKNRGGQSYFVCPRIADLGGIMTMLAAHAPDIDAVAAHGRMPAADLDRIVKDFAARKHDVLVSTTIIESGLDIPSANTLVVHHSHKLGLAQLHQIRGRVGRSQRQAYALLTIPEDIDIGETAKRRLDVLTTLDSVGAGFTLAGHDMDIRGAGNLLGDEQSGHIREIGFELFETLLAKAVEALRQGRSADDVADMWTPRVSLGGPARLPETYVPDADERISAYWRLSRVRTPDALERLAGELEQAYGPLPPEASTLLQQARIAQTCLDAGVLEMVAGPRGAVIAFRDGRKSAASLPAAAIAGIGTARLRRAGRLVVAAPWADAKARHEGARRLVEALCRPVPAFDRSAHQAKPPPGNPRRRPVIQTSNPAEPVSRSAGSPTAPTARGAHRSAGGRSRSR